MPSNRLSFVYRRVRFGSIGALALAASAFLIPSLLTFFFFQPLMGPFLALHDKWYEQVEEGLVARPIRWADNLPTALFIPCAVAVALWVLVTVALRLFFGGLFLYPRYVGEPLMDWSELFYGMRCVAVEPFLCLYVGLRYGMSLHEYEMKNHG